MFPSLLCREIKEKQHKNDFIKTSPFVDYLLVSVCTGRPVRIYGELIEYLMEKHKDIKALVMDFEGKNVMLYWLAGKTPLECPEDIIPHSTLGVAAPAHWWALSNQGVLPLPSDYGCGCDCGCSENAVAVECCGL